MRSTLLAVLAVLGFKTIGLSSAAAQSVRGIVTDSLTGRAIEGAQVVLLDSTSATRIPGTTDGRGRYLLAARMAGTFAVVTMAIGYQRRQTPWMRFAVNDTVDVFSRLERAATTLSPVIVAAQRDSIKALATLGLSLKAFSGTIITPAEVNRAALTSIGVSDLLESLRLGILRVKRIYIGERRPGMLPGWYACIVYTRTSGCVTVVVDGMRYAKFEDLAQLDNFLVVSEIAFMVFLRPNEAGVLYGTDSDNGVLTRSN